MLDDNISKKEMDEMPFVIRSCSDSDWERISWRNSSPTGRSPPGIWDSSHSTTREERKQKTETEIEQHKEAARKLTVYDIYKGFMLDVPRSDVTINGEPFQGHPTLLFMELWSKFETKRKAIEALRLFCQSELVPWFLMGRDKWVSNEQEHFLDGGRQKIDVVIERSKSGFFTSTERVTSLTIHKPFKVIDFHDEDQFRERFTVVLCVSYDFENESRMHSWSHPESHHDESQLEDDRSAFILLDL